MRRTRLVIGGLFLAVFLFIAFQAATLGLFAIQPFKPGSTEATIIEIQRGQGPREIARALFSNGVIHDPSKFVWLGKLTRQWKRIKAGEYQVSPGQSAMELFATITSGISVRHPVTVREGENIYEIATQLEARNLAKKARFLELCRDPAFIAPLWTAAGMGPPPPATLEGYLFPDTYFFDRTLATEDVIRQMFKRFRTIWGEKEEARLKEIGLTRHELVTLASMVEKETGAPQERPLIASVFYNRLKKKMRLQSDPTTIYGIWETYGGNIRKSDLLTENPYNTYTIPALPIGPISNPGKEAIQAALYPAKSEFLFFVSHNDGTHEFTRTFEDHNRAVQRFQLNPKAREGRSWRDLQKKKISN
ncbi:MAG: endolytic transglycosylase MltG [Oligoflexia bacterium]|nr:endolytic transglycosylase MltG [Oligoflexia bacterium]